MPSSLPFRPGASKGGWSRARTNHPIAEALPCGELRVISKSAAGATELKATEIRIEAYGDPRQLAPAAVSLPDPQKGQVLVRQTAIGVNFIDCYHRRGVFPLPALPGAIGVEAVGVVVATGPEVAGISVGDRVGYAGPPIGSYASARLLPARSLARLPDDIDDRTAAALMLKGMTAHMIFTRVRPLRSGDSVLVHAAAGGLGILLAQWARAKGARVIGTVSTEAKAEIARAAGCDEVIFYKRQDFVEETRRLTGGQGVDIVCEGIGGATLERSLDCLKPFGTAINLGQIGEPLSAVNLASLGPQRSLSVAVPGVFAHLRTLADLQAGVDEMLALVRSGVLTPRIGLELPLNDANEAHRALEAGETTGAIVLVPAAEFGA
nr:quinone oxidoreductase [Xanthobacter aminoxidans]